MSRARCSRCRQDVTLWAHRGDAQNHSWGNDEASCSCHPIPTCTSCDAALLREHGFLLLDEVALPSTALLN